MRWKIVIIIITQDHEDMLRNTNKCGVVCFSQRNLPLQIYVREAEGGS